MYPEKEIGTTDYTDIRRWQKGTMPGIRIIMCPRK
jgi:hypothetical protein